MTTPPAAVDIDRFSFWYGKTRALRDISLAIAPRRITAFIGPSGCGKSTLLRAINRMNELLPNTRHAGDVRTAAGSVYAPAVDVVQLRREIGMVFQKPNPFPKSIYDNVAYGPRVNALARATELADRVETALKRAALWDEVADRLDDPGTSLSGGQQQRLCIARALANDPAILLLDEPCSALDPIATQHVEELLVELRKEVTIVIVTHNLHQAARIADETAFFYLGELIEYGGSDELFTRPREKRTEAYVTGRFG
ncbi:MAG: phosphate ABC transporter ATP-binding protein PstB [Candidatus Palauibacterales bacterium]|nr:phosphate ABC transporter ATP-binding protein PstB [Candidatus Palauibacterales bacterium]